MLQNNKYYSIDGQNAKKQSAFIMRSKRRGMAVRTNARSVTDSRHWTFQRKACAKTTENACKLNKSSGALASLSGVSKPQCPALNGQTPSQQLPTDRVLRKVALLPAK